VSSGFRHGFYLILRPENQITWLTQLMWFQLSSQAQQILAVSNFKGFSELLGCA